jgi:hypothetical protein
METENVIFLGAGASAPEGAPLQSELFKEYFKYRRAHPISTKWSMDRLLAGFFRDFFGIEVMRGDINDVPFPTFEEALGVLELALDREESFTGYGTRQERQMRRVREDLIFLIAVILDKKLGDECRHHMQLVTRLKEQGQLRKTCFIDLNYDILADNALLKLDPEFSTDYGVRFTNAPTWRRTGNAIPLYKIHGSLNWLYCPTCVALTLTPGEKKVATLVFKPIRCRTCRSHMVPLIIPPSYIKVMSNYQLQSIWRRAEGALLSARRIYFCGYSFPEADIHIKYILKRAEMNSSRSPDIFVINNFEGKHADQKEYEKERYRRFFRDSARVQYTEQSFEEFCVQGIAPRAV